MKNDKRPSRILLRRLISYLIRCLYSVSYTLNYQNRLELEQPCVIAFFHDEMIPIVHEMSHTNSTMIVSSSHMGQGLSRALKTIGYVTASGTRKRSGKRAFKELQKFILDGKNVLITPDGSKGPRRKMKAGAVVLAHHTNVPLYLVTAQFSGLRAWFSWDKFIYPLPFSKVIFNHHKMILSPDLNRDEISEKICEAEDILNRMIRNKG